MKNSIVITKIKKYFKQFPILVKIKQAVFFVKKDPIDKFLKTFFSEKTYKVVVQIGANDGVMCDPLRKYLLRPNNYKAILIEPLPYYFQKLNNIYKNRDDILLLNKAVGSLDEERIIYYIPPLIADEMNGDGPANDWAHGQGSFDKEIIIHWIKKNKFRGEDYQRKIPYFIQNIASQAVEFTQTNKILPSEENLLLVIDVQGFELEVLRGINFQRAPKYILLEDDLNNIGVTNILEENNFKYLCGTSTDKIFIKNK